MKYHVIVSGEGHDCQLFVGFEGKPEGDATAADVIAALKANPEARAEVLDALGEPPASRRLDVAAAIARAEQAERERDEAMATLEFLGRRIDDVRAALNDAGAGFTGQTEGARIRALRSRLAKAEAVVEAARTDLRTADILIDGARAGAGGTTAERLEQATRGIRAALAKGGE